MKKTMNETLDEKHFQIEHQITRDSELNFMKVNAEAILIDENWKSTVVGFIQGYILNPSVFYDWGSLVSEADGIDGDMLKVVVGMKETYEEGCLGNIFVLDQIQIQPEFQGQGFGTLFMEGFLQDAFYTGVSLVGLIPGYYGSGHDEEREAKNINLVKWYKRSGFKSVSNQKNHVMVRNLELL